MQIEKFTAILQNPGLMNGETALELKLLVEKYPWFQLGWLAYLKNLKHIGSGEFQNTLRIVSAIIPQQKLIRDFLKSDESVNIQVHEFSLNDETNASLNPLIDNFLKSDKKSLRKKPGEIHDTQNGNISEVIEKSVTENDEIITDTLAQIYLQQKQYEKALNAYQKLSLKYPEKSIYFASQIEEIEKIKNNNS